MQLDYIKKLIKLLEESQLRKIHLKEGDFEIELEKEDKFAKKDHSHEKELVKYVHKDVEAQTENLNFKFIESPMVGTFYAAPAPDKQDFVKVGDFVKKDTIVCIIEAMKVMNEVKANMDGKIVEILVDNASPVEFSTKLFRVE